MINLWDTTEVGQPVPELQLPITWKFLAMAAAATQDYMPYHHHPTLPQTLGMRGPFVNTMSFQGLFGRAATDWSGDGARFRSASLSMVDQLCPGDRATISGSVTAKDSIPEADTVTLSLRLDNEIGPVASSDIVIAVPSTRVPHPTAQVLAETHPPEGSPDMPQAARDMLGRKFERKGNYPVSEAQIRYFAEAFRDGNPLYTESERARASEFGGMIAPPNSLLVWAMARASQTGIDVTAPDADAPELEPWPEPPAENLTQTFRMPGTSEVIVRRIDVTFGTPLRPGDRAHVTSRLADCSALKTSKLGKGYFVTFEDVYRNQHGDVAGRTRLALFQYGVK